MPKVLYTGPKGLHQVTGTGIVFDEDIGQTWGAGAIGDGAAPKAFRRTENGVIVTTIKIDISGLGVKGDAANDVIGLAAGGAAYIYRNEVAKNGVIFRAEVACIEVPGQGTATITTDIDLAFHASAALEYDGAAGAAEINTGGFANAGKVAVDNDLNLTDNDYLYLVEGDTAATTGVYNAGQFIIRLYGHALLT
tara:strand:- start:84 stop:665 length:582 start_codon:yes stop_codon:yes gene_type:complete